jgi:Tol biopolymer transport system component
VYYVCGVATRGANIAVRVLLVLAALVVFYGCDQPSSPPEQGERDGGVEHESATSLGPSRQETTQQETTQQETTRQDVADMKIAFGVRRPGDYEYDYDYDLYVMNADGSNLARLADGAQPAWSPDGKRFAYTKYVEEPNPAQSSAASSASPAPKIDTPYIFTMNADGSGQKKLLDKAAEHPVWSPDGKEIAFNENYCGDIYIMDADGSGTPRKLATGPGCAHSPAWSPDGKEIAYTKGSASKASDVYVANASGEDGHAQQPRVLTDHAPRVASGGAYDPSWSPDGTEIAFTFQKSGATIAVYKMDADGSGVTPLAPSQHMKKAEAASGGAEVTDMKTSPVWSPDGGHVAYVRFVPYCDPDCSNGYTLYAREIYVVNSDGTNATLVRELGKAHDIWGLDWKPLS